MSGRLIRFNPAQQDLQLTVNIRDEDTTEVLKGRWRLVTGNNPPRTPTSPNDLDYTCPEPEIVGTPGKIERSDYVINIPGSRFMRGQCYRIDVAVSATFKSCLRNPELFDITTNEDNEEDVGRAAYWVFALAGNTIDADVALPLAESCPSEAYQPPSGTSTSGVEK